MAHVVDYDDFNPVLARLERLEQRAQLLESLLLNQRWLNRQQTMIALDCGDDKLRRLTVNEVLAHRYEGRTPYYDVFSIRNYLTAKKIDSNTVNERILSAHVIGRS